MRRLLDLWWVVGSVLLVAVIVLTGVIYVGESDRHQQQQRAAQQQAVAVLSESVDDVLAREVALARVLGAVPGPIGGRWPALSNIVMSQPLANSTGFIQPVSERDRAAFERHTGLRLVESPNPGVVRAAGRESLHLVLSAYRQVGPGAPPLGLDIGANPLRRQILLQAARTGLQIATPPVAFLGRRQETRGVVVYVAVRDQHSRLEGWVSAAYEARQLASMVTAQMPGVRLTIRDGASTLTSAPGALTSNPEVIAVAGRRWSVWAGVRESGISPVPWLVLSLGLALIAAVVLILRQAATGARRSRQQLTFHDAEQAAVAQVTTLVAQGATPEAVFRSAAEQIVALFDSITGAVSRFDAASNQGVVLGGWTPDGLALEGAVYDLDGVTASAAVFRTGHAARTEVAYQTSDDPVALRMAGLGGQTSDDPIAPRLTGLGAQAGIAAPIVVAGSVWGALGAAYGEQRIPVGAEVRLERFASLVGLAISNADAFDRLARQASTDPLTGIANRRAFDERLSAEVARARRYGRDLSLAVLDLDHFKSVNDVHGHQAGDRVLVLFAQMLSGHAREDELVARIGGEEFAWLMPETDQHGAYAAADRTRNAIENAPFEDVGTVTLSAGVCSLGGSRDAQTLFRDADRALYWAKGSGRNMTFIHTDEAQATLTNDG
jgi:diguanylate cyclase (GGDEF)-like protein